MLKRSAAFSHNIDVREVPSYGIMEAAHYLRIPPATIRSWVSGRHYPTKSGKEFFAPIIHLEDEKNKLLAFMNLIEVHVLDAIRRDHKVSLEKVRIAVKFLEREFSSKHPLAEREFETDGLNLFIERYGQLINISQDGQLAMRDLLKAYLQRIERDPFGVPVKLYPFTRKREPQEPKAVVIDPRVSFGRPVLAGTGIATAVIAERYKAGESMDELADDYGRKRLEIEEAIRCELPIEAAA